MTDRWIITRHPFYQHASFALAQEEFARLQKLQPAKKFQIMRVKTNLRHSNAQEMIERLRHALSIAVTEMQRCETPELAIAIGVGVLALKDIEAAPLPDSNGCDPHPAPLDAHVALIETEPR